MPGGGVERGRRVQSAVPGIVTIILAAGASTRLGQPKQLVEFEGEALVRRSVRVALEAGAERVLVALGAEAERCRRALEGLAVETLMVEAWQDGMGATLAGAVRHLVASATPAALAVLLCDQYRVGPEHLQALVSVLEAGRKSIVAARDGAWLGPPALFRPRWYPALAKLEGERGARSLMARHPEHVEEVELAGIAEDLDVPEDLLRLRQASVGGPRLHE